MEETDLKWLESVCKEMYGISQLLSVEAKPAVTDGENYVSKIYRLTLQALSVDQQPTQISVILKRKTEFNTDNKDINEKVEEAFNKEYYVSMQVEDKVYAKVLVKLDEYFLKGESTLWPNCLAYIPYKDIYFEDLKASGYGLASRLVGLDFDHCLLAFQSFAKFHAASTIAVKRGEVDISSYYNYLFVQTAVDANKGTSNAFVMMVDVIRRDWGPEWSTVADKLEEVVKTLPEKVVKVGEYDESRINVFNHGDTWVNNMMFKYDSNEKPNSLKFVDFQLSHYNSFGCDLSYFLNTSINSENKKKHLDTWIETYCNTFAAYLDLQEPSLPRPTPDMVKSELIRLAPLSLNTAIRIRPIIMVPKDDFLPMSELLKDTGVNSKKRQLFLNPQFTKVMKKDLPELLDIILTVNK